MSKRLQVVLDEEELREIQEAKLAAIQAATRHAFPAPEIEAMLAEIERGYLDGESP